MLPTATPPMFLSVVGTLRGFPQGNSFPKTTPATVFPLATPYSHNHYEELVSRQRMIQSHLGILGRCPPASILSNQLPGLRFPWGSLSSSGKSATNFGFGKIFVPKALPVRETEKNSREIPKNEASSLEFSTPRTPSNSEKQPKSPLLTEKQSLILPSQQTTMNPVSSFNLNPFSRNNTQLPVHVNTSIYLNRFLYLLPAFHIPR